MVIREYIKNCLVIMCLTMAPWVSADTQFRLIVDASGSMLISDPDKLTAESLKLISDLAPEEKATLGVWLFGERARVLLPETLINPSSKAQLQNAIANYEPGDMQTDLESVLKMLLQTPDSKDLAPGFERHWVLVTDGMVDISLDEAVNEASRSRITNDLANELAKRGVHLHTISMTGYTDKELLNAVSTLTDATHTEVATPDSLLDTFDRIFSQASPSEEVPFEGNTFSIDDAIEEATLLIFHKEGVSPKIYRPDGQVLTLSEANVSSVIAPHYMLVTITQPNVGAWKVENVDLNRSNVRVITRLSAQATKIAPVIFVNEPIFSTVGLFQENDLIKDPAILQLMNVKQKLNILSGETSKQLFSRDLELANHQFKHKVDQITDAGNYELITEVDGKTFARKLSQFFTVATPITLEAERESENLVAFSSKPTNLRLNLLRSNARLILTQKDGSEESLEMPLIGEGFWQKVYPVQPNSAVSAHIRLIGITQTGVRFEYSTPAWYLSREGAGSVSVRQTRAEDAAASMAVAAAVNRDLVPVIVTPQVTVVSDTVSPVEEELKSELPPLEAQSDNAADTVVETSEEVISETPLADGPVEDAPLGLSKSDWILYGALNLGGLVVLVGGYLVYRRLRKKRNEIQMDL